MDSARELALQVLCRSERERIPTEPLLGPLLAQSGFAARDRRLTTILVQTTHRWRGRADQVLRGRLRKGLRSLDRWTLMLLRLGYVQLFHFDQIPPHAIVHTAVALAQKYKGEGKARLVNRILRDLLKRPPGPEEWNAGGGLEALEGELSHPPWLLERWLAHWGEETTRRICVWNNRVPSFHLRVHGDAMARERVQAALVEERHTIRPGAVLPEALRLQGTFDVGRHPLLTGGAITIQDESQMLVGHLWPDPSEGPILDLCAAPGTKTTHLAERGAQGPILAVDREWRRVTRIAQSVRRLGLEGIHPLVADGRRPPVRPVFGRVLVDAPCTSLGVLQRRPDARWLRSPGEIHDAARLQAELLEVAAGCVRPGGFLLYSLCSLEREESDERVAALRAGHPELVPVGLPDWLPQELHDPEDGILHLLPGTLGMEGLFAALFQRRPA